MNAVLFVLSILIWDIAAQMLAAARPSSPAPAQLPVLPDDADADTLVLLVKVSTVTRSAAASQFQFLPRGAQDLIRDDWAREAWAALDANGVFHRTFEAATA